MAKKKFNPFTIRRTSRSDGLDVRDGSKVSAKGHIAGGNQTNVGGDQVGGSQINQQGQIQYYSCVTIAVTTATMLLCGFMWFFAPQQLLSTIQQWFTIATPAPTIETLIATPTVVLRPFTTTPPTTPLSTPRPSAISTPPNQVTVLLQRVDTPWNQGDWSQVIDLLTQARTLDANNSAINEKLYAAHYNYGQELLTQGKKVEAAQQFENALKVRSVGIEAQQALKNLTPTATVTRSPPTSIPATPTPNVVILDGKVYITPVAGGYGCWFSLLWTHPVVEARTDNGLFFEVSMQRGNSRTVFWADKLPFIYERGETRANAYFGAAGLGVSISWTVRLIRGHIEYDQLAGARQIVDEELIPAPPRQTLTCNR